LLDISLSTLAALAVMVAMPMVARGCDGLVDGPKGTVASVVDGDTLILDSGMVVRLIGTQAPKLPLGREGYPTWPKADDAKGELEALTLGKAVRLRYGGERMDRYGRALGQLFVTGATESWVQQQMVADGMARVYSFPDNRACLAELMAAETQARAAGLGIWTDPFYTVRRADQPTRIAAREGYYELVEGRVFQAERRGGFVYLNFGRVWAEDFTVTIDRSAQRLFGDFDPIRLEGALVRVRGWVGLNGGPRIEVTHPEQIEVLSTR
jgi:endonuclease YncB( thermonuclease family)